MQAFMQNYCMLLYILKCLTLPCDGMASAAPKKQVEIMTAANFMLLLSRRRIDSD